MNRRDALSALLAALVVPTASRARGARLPRIGYLTLLADRVIE
jgi:hypothetical protein